MRNILLIIFLAFIGNLSFSQSSDEITEKRNVFNKKGDYYSDRNEFEKAIIYYNLAWQNDTTDYFSVLKKAEVYKKMKLFPQAEYCYEIVFGTGKRVANVYKLKYALTLLANDKPEEFKHWIGQYSELVNEEIEGENYLISSQERVKLYKDTVVVLLSENGQADSVKFKIKYAGYQYKRRSPEEANQINLLVSNGDEYNISGSGSNDFDFSFQPMEYYKLIIRKEDIRAEDVISDKSLSPAQKKKMFLNPPPQQKAEVTLDPEMKFDFTSGGRKITPQYLNNLRDLAGEYQDQGSSNIDLTAIVKEMEFTGGEIYTIRFVRDKDQPDAYKKMQISFLTVNQSPVNIYGQSFFLVLPNKREENFSIQTNIEELKKNFSPKKYSLQIDNTPVFMPKSPENLIPLTVNTTKIEEIAPINRLSAKEISIIPGTEYLLSLSKPNPATGEKIEVIVPLTRGVRYNLTSSLEPDTKFKAALAEFLTGRNDVKLNDEEVIDIAILSKELKVHPGEELSFCLKPVSLPGKQHTLSDDVKSTLTVDERVLEISPNEKYLINVPFSADQYMNLQTDLDYVAENFDPESYLLRLDTISFSAEIKVDTMGYGALKSTGWLSMSVNTESVEEVNRQDQFIANEVSIIPGNEYILTVTKVDAQTGEKEEIIIPLLRNVKYDFTSKPQSEEEYKKSLEAFLAGREDIETTEGTLIDITLLSKELKIAEDDEVSFSLLPVRKLPRQPVQEETGKSSLFLDDKVVEFNYIHKYTINIPLSDEGQVNMQTNLQHLQDNFDPGSFTVNLDTLSFFSELAIDTSGLGDRVITEEVITDPVFDVVVINFKVNEYLLTPDARKKIKSSVIDELIKDERLYVTIKGYTDALGDADYNLNLSRKRAESVKTYLMNNGIGDQRIRTFSFGESQALQEGIDWEDLSDEELRKHRKVEIVIYLPD